MKFGQIYGIWSRLWKLWISVHMWNLVVIPQASDMIPYSSSRRVAKYDGCQIQYWLSLPLWHYFAITYNWNHLKKLSNHHFNSDSCKKHVKFCFQDISKISPLSAFPSLIDTINLPHLGEKTCHCFHHTFDIGFYTVHQIWNHHPNLAWKGAIFFCVQKLTMYQEPLPYILKVNKSADSTFQLPKICGKSALILTAKFRDKSA